VSCSGSVGFGHEYLGRGGWGEWVGASTQRDSILTCLEARLNAGRLAGSAVIVPWLRSDS